MTTATAVAMPEATVGIVVMTNEEARACVSRIKAAAEDICALLCDLHEREGWRALGYKTWQECVKHEFQMSRQHAHRLINSHIVQRVLTPVLAERMSPIGDTLSIPESHARELAPLVDRPEVLRDAYSDALEQTNGQPTAADVHDAVDRKLGRETKPRSSKPSARRTSDPDVSQDVPDDVVLGASEVPDDAPERTADEFGDVVNNEPQIGPKRTSWCQDCGERYSGEACACKSVSQEDERTSGRESRQPSERNGGRSGQQHYSRPGYSGPPPLTIQGDAGDAMRAIADRYALDRLAEGIGEAYSDTERGSLTAQLFDSLPDHEKARVAHRANVAVKASSEPAEAAQPLDLTTVFASGGITILALADAISGAYSEQSTASLVGTLVHRLSDERLRALVRVARRQLKEEDEPSTSAAETAPTLVQVAEMGEALTPGQQLGITSRWVKAWPATDLERLATFLPHLIERKHREAAGSPQLAAAV